MKIFKHYQFPQTQVFVFTYNLLFRQTQGKVFYMKILNLDKKIIILIEKVINSVKNIINQIKKILKKLTNEFTKQYTG